MLHGFNQHLAVFLLEPAPLCPTHAYLFNQHLAVFLPEPAPRSEALCSDPHVCPPERGSGTFRVISWLC